MPTENERIKAVYQQRDKQDDGRYSYADSTNLFLIQTRERTLLKLLGHHQLNAATIGNQKILSLGCGTGTELINLLTYGAKPASLFGLDLLQSRIRLCKQRLPQLGLVQANGGQIPFPQAQFSLILQFTVFTSILEATIRQQVAAEMLRVLQPNGKIIWYDFWVNNPANPHVKGIKPAEIKALFPNCTCHFQRVTLAPPLARRIVPFSWLLAELLAKIPWLLTHYLVIIEKNYDENPL